MKVQELTYNAKTLDEVLSGIFQAVLGKEPHRVLWLCPSRRLVRDRTSRFASFIHSSARKGSFLPDFRTLNDYAAEQFGLEHPDLRFVSQEERIWTVEEALLENGARAASGLSAELVALISNFKAYVSCYPEEVRRAIEKAYDEWLNSFQPALDAGVFERARERLDRVLRIFEGYEGLKQERGLFDEFDAYYLKELKHFNYDFVVVDSFQDFFPAQRSFLDRIVQKSPETVFLKNEFSLPDKEGFLLSEDSGRKAISITGYLTPALEVRSVAGQIASLIKSGVRPEEILVVVPELSGYARIISTVFESEGIKANISQGYSLSVSPAGSFILSLLNYLKDSEYAHSFYELALSFLIAALKPEQRVTYQAIKEFFARNDFYLKDEFLKNLRRTFLKKGLVDASDIFEKVEALRSAENLSEALDIIEQIVLLVHGFLKEDQKAEKDLEAILEGINRFRSSRIFEAEREKPLDTGRLLSVFRTILARPSRSFTGDIAEGVQVSGILETRGIVSDFVFLVGFTDRAFPGNPLKTYILPDGIKQRLKIPTSDEYLLKQKMDFYRLISSARYGVFISYHQQEKNEVFLESRFVTELRSLLGQGLVRGAFQVNVEDFAVLERKMKPAGKIEIKVPGIRFKDSVSLSVSTLRQIVACRAKFYLIANDFSTVQLPAAVPDSKSLGRFFHKMISDFVSKYNALESAAALQIAEWVEEWIDSNLDSEEFRAYRLEEFFGRSRLLQIGIRVAANLEEYMSRSSGIMVPEGEIENLSKSFVHEGTGVKVTIRGRPDLMVCDRQGKVREIVDFKFFEKNPGSLLRQVSEEIRFQLFLYNFLLSDAAAPEDFNASASVKSKFMGFVLAGEDYFEEHLEPDDELYERFKNYLIEAVEIAVRPEFPSVEKCSEYNCFLSEFCPVAGGLKR